MTAARARAWPLIGAVVFLSGCLDSVVRQLSPDNEPQVVNTPEKFEFSATDLRNVNDVLNFTWTNPAPTVLQPNSDHYLTVTTNGVVNWIVQAAGSTAPTPGAGVVLVSQTTTDANGVTASALLLPTTMPVLTGTWIESFAINIGTLRRGDAETERETCEHPHGVFPTWLSMSRPPASKIVTLAARRATFAFPGRGPRLIPRRR